MVVHSVRMEEKAVRPARAWAWGMNLRSEISTFIPRAVQRLDMARPGFGVSLFSLSRLYHSESYETPISEGDLMDQIGFKFRDIINFFAKFDITFREFLFL